MIVEKYQESQAVDFEDMELGSLTDVSEIRIDRGQPVEKRRQQYLEKVGNPYLVRVGINRECGTIGWERVIPIWYGWGISRQRYGLLITVFLWRMLLKICCYLFDLAFYNDR